MSMAFVIVLWKNGKRRRVGKENSSSVFQDSKPIENRRSIIAAAEKLFR
jgi:hypothetical protein